jgi:hypothetical protein
MVDRQLFLTGEEHNDFIQTAIDLKPSKVFISTFGIYLGITYDGRDTTEWGPEYAIRTRELAESMRSLPDVNIMVGLQNYRSCKGKISCIDCEKQYVRGLIRLMNHAELFPEFTWKMTTDLHLKCALFFYTKPKPDTLGVTGGRNFTDSSWEDATFTMAPSEIGNMWQHIKPTWKEAWDITDSAISDVLEKQEISQKGFESVLAGIDELGSKPTNPPF